MRKEKLALMKLEVESLSHLTGNLEIEIGKIRNDFKLEIDNNRCPQIYKERKMYMKQMTLGTIEKKLEKKNMELEELREFRKKLNAKEKEICDEIEKLKNQKVEVIFAQVKRGIKNENLDISSDSVLQMLAALRKDSELEELGKDKGEMPQS